MTDRETACNGGLIRMQVKAYCAGKKTGRGAFTVTAIMASESIAGQMPSRAA